MILVAGSANLDFVVRAAHIPAPGETVLGRTFDTYPGGKGANQACASARAGAAATRFLCALGRDTYAIPIQESLHEAGVALETIETPNDRTGTAFICVSDNAENAITVAPGANLRLAPGDLSDLNGVSHLLMQLEIPLPTVEAFAHAARAVGVQVVLNAAPMQPLSKSLLQALDILILNEGELRTLAGSAGSILECMERVDVPTVIVTLGAKGCCAYQQGIAHFQPAYPVSAVDTTGAGDTFCGTLVAALSHHPDLPRALRHASAAAALACTRMGAQTSVPNAADVAELARQTASPAQWQTLQTYCRLSLVKP